MATALSSTGGMSGVMQGYYDKLALETLLPELRLYNFGEKRPLPKRHGRDVSWRRWVMPAATTALTEGTAPSAQAASANMVSALLEQLGYVYGISDVLELTAIDSQIEEAVRILGKHAALTIDTYIRNAIIDGATKYIERISGNYANTNTRTTISAVYSADTACASVVRAAMARLKRLNVPTINGDYILLMDPHSADQLKAETATGGWLDVHKYAQPGEIYSGEVGRLFGFRVIEVGTHGTAHDGSVYVGSSQSTSATSVCAVYNLAFGQGFFGVTEVDGGVKTYVKTENPYDKSDPLNQFSTVGYKWTGTAKILNPSCGVIVPTAVVFD